MLHKNCNLIFILRNSRNISVKSVSFYLERLHWFKLVQLFRATLYMPVARCIFLDWAVGRTCEARGVSAPVTGRDTAVLRLGASVPAVTIHTTVYHSRSAPCDRWRAFLPRDATPWCCVCVCHKSEFYRNGRTSHQKLVFCMGATCPILCYNL